LRIPQTAALGNQRALLQVFGSKIGSPQLRCDFLDASSFRDFRYTRSDCNFPTSSTSIADNLRSHGISDPSGNRQRKCAKTRPEPYVKILRQYWGSSVILGIGYIRLAFKSLLETPSRSSQRPPRWPIRRSPHSVFRACSDRNDRCVLLAYAGRLQRRGCCGCASDRES